MIELTLADFRAIKAAYWSACGAYADACHERDELANRLNQALTNYRALQSAYGAASRDRDELVGLLLETTAERDRARTTATRLEAELARGFPDRSPGHHPQPRQRTDNPGHPRKRRWDRSNSAWARNYVRRYPPHRERP